MTDMTAEEAAHRHAKAAVAGNLTQLMADLTPDALAGLMAQGGAGGGFQQPAGYELKLHAQEGDDYVFDIIYTGPAGNITLRDRLRKIGDEWKIVEANIV
jgi:hypothetical protein